MKRNSKLLIGFAGCLLLIGAGYQLVGPHARMEKRRPVEFEKILPAELSGWTVVEKPLADSPEMLRNVESILNFDAATFRTYTQGSTEISVYAAYWLPGKADRYAVEAHTPDICWVHNGWKMEKVSPLSPVPLGGTTVEVPNVRIFEVNGVKLNVAFWQVYGDRIEETASVSEAHMTFSERASRRAVRVWETISTPPQEQLFLRISTNSSLAEALDSEPVRHYLAMVAQMLNGRLLGK